MGRPVWKTLGALGVVRIERGKPLPRYVEEELRRYPRCGILAHGFLHLRAWRIQNVTFGAAGPFFAAGLIPSGAWGGLVLDDAEVVEPTAEPAGAVVVDVPGARKLGIGVRIVAGAFPSERGVPSRSIGVAAVSSGAVPDALSPGAAMPGVEVDRALVRAVAPAAVTP